MNKARLLIFLLVLGLATGCVPKQEIQIIQAEQNSITVSGQGKIKVTPDRARIVFSVLTRNKDIPTAQDQNHQISSKILATLKELGVKDTSIKTNFLNLSSETGGTSPLYNAMTAIEVTTQDLGKMEEIVTSSLKSVKVEKDEFYFDVNIQAIYFEISNMDYYRGQARSMALQAAKSKAVIMANELGQEIGEPISIKEGQAYPNNYTYYGGDTNEYTYFQNTNIRTAAVFDKITVSSDVTVEFSLK